MLIETGTVVSEEPISEEELAAADVVPEQSEAQQETPREGPLSDDQPTEVLRAEDLGPFAREPEEPPAEGARSRPRRGRDATIRGIARG